jgi:uncharacterized LabA/DUF88 family protein
MRTTIYVDGFNLFNRALKRKPHYRWLNLKTLSEEILDDANVVQKVNFYTARISGKFDPESPRRQQLYFDALSSIPEIEIHQGTFRVDKKYAPLAPPPNGGKPPFQPWPKVARIIKTEEKGSDVNLGVHLVRDACQDRFDVAVIISNDTDLLEPMRIASQEIGKVIGVICPSDRPSVDIRDNCAFLRRIRNSHLAKAQFDPEIQLPDGSTIKQPTKWTAGT